MRAAVFNGPGKPISIERVADPRPAGNELVVQIARCGICGSDVSMTSAGRFAYASGRRLGHEYAGEVVAIGPGSLRSFVTRDARLVAHKPDFLSMEEAVMLPAAFMTANCGRGAARSPYSSPWTARRSANRHYPWP